MAMLTRWDPFRELGTIHDRINHLFEQSVSSGPEESLSAGVFIPPADIYEDENYITLKLEVPGIDKKDLDIRIEGNTLVVKGERKMEKEVKEEGVRRTELRYGVFTKAFGLPNYVDTDNIQANYDKGELTIPMAKRAEAKP